MSVRFSAALLILLPACASCLASPVGVLVGPFAGQVLAQQRQEAQQAQHKADVRKPEPGANAACRPERAEKTAAPGNATKPRCEMPADEAVAVRNRTDLDPLPEPDKPRTSD
ncbi:MAG: hypothetical protein ACXWC4_05360 [Telluria sp.]